MTRADIEHLLTQTHAEYSGGAPPPPSVVLPAARPAAAMPAAEANPAPIIPPASQSRPQPLSGGALAIIFAILLIGLGIAFSINQGYFQQRSSRTSTAVNPTHPKPADTVKNNPSDSSEDEPTPPFQPTAVPPGQLPPEAEVGPPTSPAPSNPPKHTPTHHARSSAAHPLLQTSSEFDAEERLADLRADGNSKARIKAVHKHGTVSYQVLAK